MTLTLPEAISAIGLGLAGAGHCLGMCGGVAVALGMGQGKEHSGAIQLAYHAGRLTSYAALGFLAGFTLEFAAAGQPGVLTALRYVAGVMLLALAGHIAGWWRALSALERLGARAWQPVRQFSRRFLPVRHPGHAAALGLCWGAMPCGLIYSSLAWAASSANWLESGILMFLFGMGTLPAMLATTLYAARVQSILKARNLQQLIALALLVAGCWTLYMANSSVHHHAH